MRILVIAVYVGLLVAAGAVAKKWLREQYGSHLLATS